MKFSCSLLLMTISLTAMENQKLAVITTDALQSLHQTIEAPEISQKTELITRFFDVSTQLSEYAINDPKKSPILQTWEDLYKQILYLNDNDIDKTNKELCYLSFAIEHQLKQIELAEKKDWKKGTYEYSKLITHILGLLTTDIKCTEHKLESFKIQLTELENKKKELKKQFREKQKELKAQLKALREQYADSAKTISLQIFDTEEQREMTFESLSRLTNAQSILETRKIHNEESIREYYNSVVHHITVIEKKLSQLPREINESRTLERRDALCAQQKSLEQKKVALQKVKSELDFYAPKINTPPSARRDWQNQPKQTSSKSWLSLW